MILSKGICVLLLLALSGQAAAAAGDKASTPGEMRISGEIVEAPCRIDYPDRDQWLDFGPLTVREILQQSDSNLQYVFHVRLVGCTLLSRFTSGLNWHRAQVTFLSDTPGSSDRLVSVVGEAKGFAIRLSAINGEPIIFGQPTNGIELVDGNNVLNFKASIVPLRKNITAGSFYASVHFFMDYL